MDNNYKCKVPVLVKIWIRPEQQRMQFDVIKKVKPYKLFLVSDGGRNDEERNIINSNRKMILDSISWDCDVYKLFEEKNFGLYTMDRKAMDFVWSKVDRCILLEDDIIPSTSFFYFCEELLERYLNDTRISYITGTNLMGQYKDVIADYFFSPGGSISGIASWKREYDTFYKFLYKNDSYVYNLLFNQIPNYRHSLKKQIKDFTVSTHSGRFQAGDEFFYGLSRYAQNQLVITPKYNLVSNFGDTRNSSHYDEFKYLPMAIQKTIHMKTFELNFPLNHPDYVIADYRYANYLDRVYGRSKFSSVSRRIEHYLRIVLLGGTKEIKNRIYKAKNRERKER